MTTLVESAEKHPVPLEGVGDVGVAVREGGPYSLSAGTPRGIPRDQGGAIGEGLVLYKDWSDAKLVGPASSLGRLTLPLQ